MPDSVGPVNTPLGPAGWFPDPVSRYEYRYYNGTAWTADVATNGQRAIDPAGAPSWDPGWSAWAPGQAPPAVVGAKQPGRGMGIAAFVVGLVSLLGAWLPFVFAVAAIGAVIGLVLGISAVRAARRHPGASASYGTIGIILSAIAIPMCVVGFGFTRTVLREVNRYLDPGKHEVTVDRCDIEAAPSTSSGSVVVNLPRRIDLVGTVRNLDTTTRSYTVFVDYRDGSTMLDTDTITVDDVAPGASGRFEGTTFVTTGGPVQCVVTDVLGKTPFGQLNPPAP